MKKFLMFLTVALLLATPSHRTSASGIGIPEVRTWHVCMEKYQAIAVANYYATRGPDAGTMFWEAAVVAGDCFSLHGYSMFPQAVIFRKGDNRVVRVADEANFLWYWVALEPVVGEPMPVTDDVAAY